MKNSNGSVRRNFFRSSSRRSRVGPLGGSGAQSIGAQQQQSLIANRNSAGGAPAHQRNQNSKQQREAQAQLSPMEPGEQPVQQQQQSAPAGTIRQHNPPSEFGGSSSGGFTYFSGEFLSHWISADTLRFAPDKRSGFHTDSYKHIQIQTRAESRRRFISPPAVSIVSTLCDSFGRVVAKQRDNDNFAKSDPINSDHFSLPQRARTQCASNLATGFAGNKLPAGSKAARFYLSGSLRVVITLCAALPL